MSRQCMLLKCQSMIQVFLDETGCDLKNVLKRRAYSFWGKPAVSHKLLVRGKHLNAIAFMSSSGIN